MKKDQIQESLKGAAICVLDYILFEEKMMPLINEVNRDQEKYNTLFRVTMSKKENRITCANHCATLVVLIESPKSLEPHR